MERKGMTGLLRDGEGGDHRTAAMERKVKE